MKNTDLRIGNLFEFAVNSKIKYWSVSDILTNPDEVYFKENPEYNHYLNLKPIRLTEQLLVRLGFRKSSDRSYFLPIPLLSMEIHAVLFRNEWLIELSNDKKNIVTEVYHVHQLQNLYHALTGQELTIWKTQSLNTDR